MTSSSCAFSLYRKPMSKTRWIMKSKYAVCHAAATGCRSATRNMQCAMLLQQGVFQQLEICSVLCCYNRVSFSNSKYAVCHASATGCRSATRNTQCAMLLQQGVVQQNRNMQCAMLLQQGVVQQLEICSVPCFFNRVSFSNSWDSMKLL